jgi:hypothetical protein
MLFDTLGTAFDVLFSVLELILVILRFLPTPVYVLLGFLLIVALIRAFTI